MDSSITDILERLDNTELNTSSDLFHLRKDAIDEIKKLRDKIGRMHGEIEKLRDKIEVMKEAEMLKERFTYD